MRCNQRSVNPRALVGTAVTVALMTAPAVATAQRYDVLITNGTVIDGTGAPRRLADLAIAGDRVARITAPGQIPQSAARTVIDARGLIVAPGFIDLHAHVNEIGAHPRPENFLRQGITTTLASLHSQPMPWPLDRYIAELHIALNVGFFAGHNWIRRRVLGMDNRAPTAAELAHMQALVDSAMQQGAMGLASGLEYVPGAYSSTGELVAMAKVASRYGGLYITHMRDEGAGVQASVQEVLRIARDAHIPAQINHLKAAGASQFGLVPPLLSTLDSARRTGLDVAADAYPYTAFSTISDVLFPAWALAGDTVAYHARIADPAQVERLVREMRVIFPQQAGDGPSSIVFRELASAPTWAGRSLADYAVAHGAPPTIEGVLPLLIELQGTGGFIAVFHAMDAADVDVLMRSDRVALDSDGDLVTFGVGVPHPRSYGAFPRLLGTWVRERQQLTLEAAIRKITSLPAARAKLTDRGTLAVGRYADVVIFDANTIGDEATYAAPHQYARGVRELLVNGIPVMHLGVLTDALPGHAVMRAGTPGATRTRASNGRTRAPAKARVAGSTPAALYPS